MAANKNVKDQEQAIAIETLKMERNTPDAIYQGVLAGNGWKPGKAVTAGDYDRAVKEFLRSGMDGRKG